MNAQQSSDRVSRAGRRRLCGAKNRRGEKCRKPPMANGRCAMHGGKTPRAEASPHFVHGFRMRHLPADLQQLAIEATADPDLYKLRQDLAHIEALIAKLHAGLTPGRAVPQRIEDRLPNLIDLRGRTLDREARRLVQLQQMVRAERFVRAQETAAAVTVDVIRELCAQHEITVESWLALVRARYANLLRPAAIPDGDRDESSMPIRQER